LLSFYLCASFAVHAIQTLRKLCIRLDSNRITNRKVFLAAPSLKSCPRSLPDLSECIREAIELVRPNLATGNFGEGFETDSFDPFLIGDIFVNKGVKIDLLGMQARGIPNFSIDKISINPDDFKVSLILQFMTLSSQQISLSSI